MRATRLTSTLLLREVCVVQRIQLLLATLAIMALPACSQTAFVTGRWVYLSGGEHVAAGQAETPARGAPLHLMAGSAAGGACMSAEDYANAFGGTCPNEEAMGESPLVRWYCGGDLTVRVRFEACEERPDRFRVVEVAVATRYAN